MFQRGGSTAPWKNCSRSAMFKVSFRGSDLVSRCVPLSTVCWVGASPLRSWTASEKLSGASHSCKTLGLSFTTLTCGCTCELFVRLRWRAERDHAAVAATGSTSNHHPAKPSGTLFRMAVADKEWWNENLQRSAILHLTRIKSATAVQMVPHSKLWSAASPELPQRRDPEWLTWLTRDQRLPSKFLPVHGPRCVQGVQSIGPRCADLLFYGLCLVLRHLLQMESGTGRRGRRSRTGGSDISRPLAPWMPLGCVAGMWETRKARCGEGLPTRVVTPTPESAFCGAHRSCFCSWVIAASKRPRRLPDDVAGRLRRLGSH